MQKKPILLFVSTSLLLLLIFLLFPINLFDGVIEYEEPLRSYSVEAPLSLSYFVGIGYDEADMEYVRDFYLTAKGWMLAGIVIVGLPGLLAFRLSLTRNKK